MVSNINIVGGTGSIDGEYVEWGDATVTPADNDTTQIWVEDGDGDGYGSVNSGTSGFPGGVLELHEVTASGGGIVKVVDVRPILLKSSGKTEGDLEVSTGDSGAIYADVAGGAYQMASGVGESAWNHTIIRLNPDTRNYIWAEDTQPDGTATVEQSDSGYPGSGDFVELWRIDTDAGSATNRIDDRPPDLSDSQTDSSTADVVLSDQISIDDSVFSIEELLRITDTLALSDSGLLPALGIAPLGSDTLAVADSLGATGKTGLSDTLSVADGGTATTGADADQNPNTQWEILGGQHDTSGHEYEGGGVVTRYDG